MAVRLGQGFSDFVRREQHHGQVADIEQGLRRSVVAPRVVPLFIIFTLVLSILFIRLTWVTIVKGTYYRGLADGNRVREVITWAQRGVIYDRFGEVLTTNKPIYRKGSWSKKEGQTYLYYSQEEYIKLESENNSQDIEEFVTREYPYSDIFSHVLGYVGEVDEKDVESGKKLGSLIGKTGLEQTYDQELRGREGKVLVETNSLGDSLKELDRVDPHPGTNLHTTLDLSLQKKSAKAMEDKPGAVIVSIPDTGEILVLYSNPSFNPNEFVNRDSRVNSYFKDPQRPLFNRSIGGLYPPGSTFKLISAAAALEKGSVDASTIFVDNGIIEVGPYKYRNWYFTQYGRTEGEVDIVKALSRSVDTYFYELGGVTGIESIATYAKKFGLGQTTGIKLPGELPGRMPDPDWKQATKNDRWYLGDTYITSIGQGDILVNPLQVNLFTSVIANQGKLCKPQLIEGSPSCTDLKLSPETLKLIKAGMTKACEPEGTGFPLFNFTVGPNGPVDPWATASAKLKDKLVSIPTACKTGTAEFGNKDKTHAWFTVFAPVENPEIVVTVLLEEGGSGSQDAAPIAKEILGEYFKTGF